MSLFELKKQHAEALSAAEQIIKTAKTQSRPMTAQENERFEEYMGQAAKLEPQIETINAENTLLAAFGKNPIALVDVGRENPNPESESVLLPEQGRAQAKQVRTQFGQWARTVAGSLSGMTAASDPSGAISVGVGSGLYPASFAVPFEVLPFERSYFAFSPFERAGARVIATSHMRDVRLPVLAAGAAPASFAEAEGPAADASGSQPFGMSGFTLKANKRSRQVIADWESLMSTEYPLQPMILDELLTAIANAQTLDGTTALFAAMQTGGSGSSNPPLQIVGGSGGVQADVYGQLTALRHSLVEGLEAPTNAFMLSRNTLAVIRNTRASTAGTVMFDPNSDTILGRPYVVNEFFDDVMGAGYVCYGNFSRGAFLRRTPLFTRVLQERYATTNEVGFLTTSWADNHFLAELVNAANPPSHQPLYFTVLGSDLLS